MVLIQFKNTIDTDTLPVNVIQYLRHSTYLLDVQLTDYEHINTITSDYEVVSMQSNDDCAYISVLQRHTRLF